MNTHTPNTKNPGRVTVKEISREAGVSIGTVDRVLHGRPGVSERTKAKIEAIIENLGYTPNALARNLSLNKRRVVHILMPFSNQDSGYWALCRRGVEAGIAEFADYGIEPRIEEFNRYDRPAFRRLLSRFAENPGDGLLVAPVLPDELLRGLVGLAPEYPYVFFDGSIEGAHPFAAIGQDAVRAGHAAARMMSLLAPEAKNYIALNAHAEDRHIRQRIKGFTDFFAETRKRSDVGPGISVEDCFDIEDPVALDAFLTRLFGSTRNVDGILVANASGHSVGEWLVSSGHKAGCALVTWDLVPANEKGLREGAVDCVVSQRPFDQGKRALATLVRHVTGVGADPGNIEIPIEIWLRENLPVSG